MQNASALTKPRYSILHIALFAAVFIVGTSLLTNWSDFKDGVRDGYNSAAASSPAR